MKMKAPAKVLTLNKIIILIFYMNFLQQLKCPDNAHSSEHFATFTSGSSDKSSKLK